MRFSSLVLFGIILLAGEIGAQELPSGTVLVANMDDDSVWLLDLATGERRAVVRTHRIRNQSDAFIAPELAGLRFPSSRPAESRHASPVSRSLTSQSRSATSGSRDSLELDAGLQFAKYLPLNPSTSGELAR